MRAFPSGEYQEALPKKRSLAPWGKEGLFFLRPQDDPGFAGVWGLPAVSLEEAAQEKLSARVAGPRPVAYGHEERSSYHPLWVYEARLLSPPQLPEPKPTAFRLGRPEDLKEAARRGSLCGSLYRVKGLCP